MDQEKMIEQLEEAVLDKLPVDAVKKLADLTDLEGEHTDEAQAILDEYGVNVEAVAKELFKEKNNE